MTDDTSESVGKSVLMDSIMSSATPDASASPSSPMQSTSSTDSPSAKSSAQSTGSDSPTRPTSPKRRISFRLPLETERSSAPARETSIDMNVSDKMDDITRTGVARKSDVSDPYAGRERKNDTIELPDSKSLTYLTLGACSLLTLVSAAMFF